MTNVSFLFHLLTYLFIAFYSVFCVPVFCCFVDLSFSMPKLFFPYLFAGNRGNVGAVFVTNLLLLTYFWHFTLPTYLLCQVSAFIFFT